MDTNIKVSRDVPYLSADFKGDLEKSREHYNKTQLYPEKAFERHVLHRDMMAHYFRWMYVYKNMVTARKTLTVLDVGCGNGNLLRMLYHNRMQPKKYLGIDVRTKTILNNREEFKQLLNVQFEFLDATYPLSIQQPFLIDKHWDIVCCFEVLEHVQKRNVPLVLKHISEVMNNDSILYLSTPNYDPKVGAADNHTIDGEVQELTHQETAHALDIAGFEVIKKFGTFCSQKDVIPKMQGWELQAFNCLSEYYPADILSIMFAVTHPEESRNCLWVCKLKGVVLNGTE